MLVFYSPPTQRCIEGLLWERIAVGKDRCSTMGRWTEKQSVMTEEDKSKTKVISLLQAFFDR